MKIRCTTLFDITKTNVSNRRNILTDNPEKFNKERKQQSNFETILQIISLRSQPENITDPAKQPITKSLWGNIYNFKKTNFQEWSFTFTINHAAVFKDTTDEFGKLKTDCDGVPMIIGLDEFSEVFNSLNTTDKYKNIHFEQEND